MTPEEYDRLKSAEKEHLRKLKELKQAVRVLERQKKIQSDLEKMSRASDDALQAQSEAVERLALETAHQEARLDVAMDSAESTAPAKSDEVLEEELRAARAQALVERLKQAIGDGVEFDAPEAENASQETRVDSGKTGSNRDARRSTERSNEEGGVSGNPTKEGRPEKTIGRM